MTLINQSLVCTYRSWSLAKLAYLYPTMYECYISELT